MTLTLLLPPPPPNPSLSFTVSLTFEAVALTPAFTGESPWAMFAAAFVAVDFPSAKSLSLPVIDSTCPLALVRPCLVSA